MPKVTMTFNLPEEEQDLKLAQRGSHYFSVIWMVLQQIRSYLKHGHQFQNADDALENIRETLLEAQIDDIE